MTKLYINTTMKVDLTKLFDTIDAEYVQGAAVTCDLLNSVGVAVAGGDGLAFEQVAGTTGKATIYRALIPEAVTALVVEGATYTVRATAVHPGDDSQREFNLACIGARG